MTRIVDRHNYEPEGGDLVFVDIVAEPHTHIYTHTHTHIHTHTNTHTPHRNTLECCTCMRSFSEISPAVIAAI